MKKILQKWTFDLQNVRHVLPFRCQWHQQQCEILASFLVSVLLQWSDRWDTAFYRDLDLHFMRMHRVPSLLCSSMFATEFYNMGCIGSTVNTCNVKNENIWIRKKRRSAWGGSNETNLWNINMIYLGQNSIWNFADIYSVVCFFWHLKREFFFYSWWQYWHVNCFSDYNECCDGQRSVDLCSEYASSVQCWWSVLQSSTERSGSHWW